MNIHPSANLTRNLTPELFANSHHNYSEIYSQSHTRFTRNLTPDSHHNYSETYSRIHTIIIRKLIREFTP